MKWKCQYCGETLYKKLANSHICYECHYDLYGRHRTEYMREYMRTRRWLNGGNDFHLIGDKMKSVVRTNIDGKLFLKK